MDEQANLKASEAGVAAHELVRRLSATASRHELAHPGGTMVWRYWGQGEPVILLHGSHGGWLHWVRNIEALAADRKVIVPDLPGFGESDPPHDQESPGDHGELLAKALDTECGSEQYDIVGFSLGALIGCHVAIVRPDSVRRLIMVDAGGLDTPMRFADFRSTRGVPLAERRAVNRHNLGAMMLHDPATIDDLAVEIAMHYGPMTRTRVQFHVVPDKLLDPLAKVRAPIDLIWAEHDFAHPDPDANAAVVRQSHPNALLRVVPGAGHWAMYEQPDAFNAAVRDLLAQPVRSPRPE